MSAGTGTLDWLGLSVGLVDGDRLGSNGSLVGELDVGLKVPLSESTTGLDVGLVWGLYEKESDE